MTTCRPWGSFTVLVEGPGYKVKQLDVLPGQRLSQQLHRHRREVWVGALGVLVAEVDGVETTVSPGDVVVVPRGSVHRLSNRTTEPGRLMEVQQGPRVDEDDIVRLADDHGRCPQ